MKKFFGIEEKFRFELMDLFSLLTILNVIFILMGFWWAPILGLVNCVLNIYFFTKTATHVNAYIMQIALIILNIYFLTL